MPPKGALTKRILCGASVLTCYRPGCPAWHGGLPEGEETSLFAGNMSALMCSGPTLLFDAIVQVSQICPRKRPCKQQPTTERIFPLKAEESFRGDTTVGKEVLMNGFMMKLPVIPVSPV